jgi:microcystin-dependent protein
MGTTEATAIRLEFCPPPTGGTNAVALPPPYPPSAAGKTIQNILCFNSFSSILGIPIMPVNGSLPSANLHNHNHNHNNSNSTTTTTTTSNSNNLVAQMSTEWQRIAVPSLRSTHEQMVC